MAIPGERPASESRHGLTSDSIRAVQKVQCCYDTKTCDQGQENATRMLGKRLGEGQLGKPTHRQENGIKLDSRNVG